MLSLHSQLWSFYRRRQTGWAGMICPCKAVLRALVLLHGPEMDSLIFPETETRLIWQSFPKFRFWFFWRQSYITNFSTCCCIKNVITPGIIYVKSLHISPVAVFLIIPVYPTLFGGSGRVERGMLKSLWREILLQTPGNSKPIAILLLQLQKPKPVP